MDGCGVPGAASNASDTFVPDEPTDPAALRRGWRSGGVPLRDAFGISRSLLQGAPPVSDPFARGLLRIQSKDGQAIATSVSALRDQ